MMLSERPRLHMLAEHRVQLTHFAALVRQQLAPDLRPELGLPLGFVLQALQQHLHLTVLLAERLEDPDESIESSLDSLHLAGALRDHRIHTIWHGNLPS